MFELLRTGGMLCNLATNLVEALPADAYPDEEPATVVTEMLCGTIANGLGSVDPADVRRATELIDLAGARTLEDLELARQLSRRLDEEDGNAARTAERRRRP